jgi:Transposase IS4
MSWTMLAKDKLSLYKPFIEAVNSRTYAIIVPGKMVAMDEAMCKCVPLLMFDDAEDDDMPHVLKLLRKTVSVGGEFKVLADVQTGVTLRLEVVKSQGNKKREEFGDTDRAKIDRIVRFADSFKRRNNA